MEIKGKHNTAKVFASIIESSAMEQIRLLCDQPFGAGSKIRIMPDVHAGAGCTIGTTMTITDKIVPNLVGVDIGCGMETVRFREKELDLARLDKVIYEHVPSGKNVHEGRKEKFEKLETLHCFRELKDSKRIERSLGSLGGGNHFIEANRDDEGYVYLVVHSGSRNLGKQVAEYYQALAYDLLRGKGKLFDARDKLIEEYKKQGRREEIQAAVKALTKSFEASEVTGIPKGLEYVEGKYFDMYIDDMKICQEFATLNRKTIADIIMKKAGLNPLEQFTTIHNYIDTDSMILRKGAVSAKKGERLLIPINMRDGSIVCTGLGNDDYNHSAPHGAGRLMSRGDAKQRLNMNEYESMMKGIYTTSVSGSTLDECPLAYKPIDAILENIADTVKVEKIIKPIYNFKAGE